MSHIKLFITASLFFSMATNGFAQDQFQLDSTTLKVDTVITGLNVPWEIQWGPDGWIWMTERYGILSRVNPENGTKQELLDLRDQVRQSGESGMLGLALHPDFQDSSYVYVVYTYDDGDFKEKLVRYEFNGTTLVDPFILIDNIPANTTHNGSRLLILPDYTILMTTGDAQRGDAPQDKSQLNGKTLRLNLDGTIPSDNPMEGNPVWTWGHRNAQGLAMSPGGKIYSSEHGPDTDDELNILEKGNNYGWPNVEGYCNAQDEMLFCNSNDVTEPVVNWTPTIATSDIIWYNHDAIPEFKNTILLTTLKDKKVVRINLNETGDEVIETSSFFSDSWGRLRDILQGPEGELYIATNGASWSNVDPNTHTILKLQNQQQPTNIRENHWSDYISVYPNPVNGMLNLAISDNSLTIKSIMLTDMNGKTIKVYQDVNSKQRYNVRSLSPGVYGLKIKTNKGFIFKKFIKLQ